jgi:hypothetical protein
MNWDISEEPHTSVHIWGKCSCIRESFRAKNACEGSWTGKNVQPSSTPITPPPCAVPQCAEALAKRNIRWEKNLVNCCRGPHSSWHWNTPPPPATGWPWSSSRESLSSRDPIYPQLWRVSLHQRPDLPTALESLSPPETRSTHSSGGGSKNTWLTLDLSLAPEPLVWWIELKGHIHRWSGLHTLSLQAANMHGMQPHEGRRNSFLPMQSSNWMTDLRLTKTEIRLTQDSPFLQRDHILKGTSNQTIIRVSTAYEREGSPKQWGKVTFLFPGNCPSCRWIKRTFQSNM